MFNLFGTPLTLSKCSLSRQLLSFPLRGIKLHEYQAGKLLHSFKVPIPLGNVAFNPKEAFLVASQFGTNKQHEYVVKAQVLGGGRGLGYFKENNYKGGVHIVKTPQEVQEVAEKMCGKTLITKQSGDTGFSCNCVYIVEKISIEKEFYLSVALDRKAGMPVIIYSPEGGMSIEDVAHSHPEKIFKVHVNLKEGLNIDDLLDAAKNLGVEK
jgi:succinyl-CoA synthetase beta subunit